MQKDLGITFVHVTHTQPEAIALADLVVVMNQGSIEQAASAREVYAEPRSPYVARFMGGQNVLRGRVRDAEGDVVMLDGPEGATFRAPRRDLRVVRGEDAQVAVRRDLIRLVRGGADGALPENAVRGVVEAVEYQGTYVKVTIAGASGEEFIVNEPDSDYIHRPVEAGDPILATWEPVSARLLDADRVATGAAKPYAEAAA